MAYEHFDGGCHQRGWQTVFQRPAINHVAHLLASIFLCLLWLPVWFLVVLTQSPWRCSQCGARG
jgi:hypothetical protein